uniref:Uncharacterized protein n=1 Tax=Cacopsylla melanoneura TaxID=428564 RepID=A0A8D8MCA4_9HEMI
MAIVTVHAIVTLISLAKSCFYATVKTLGHFFFFFLEPPPPPPGPTPPPPPKSGSGYATATATARVVSRYSRILEINKLNTLAGWHIGEKLLRLFSCINYYCIVLYMFLCDEYNRATVREHEQLRKQDRRDELEQGKIDDEKIKQWFHNEDKSSQDCFRVQKHSAE